MYGSGKSEKQDNRSCANLACQEGRVHVARCGIARMTGLFVTRSMALVGFSIALDPGEEDFPACNFGNQTSQFWQPATHSIVRQGVNCHHRLPSAAIKSHLIEVTDGISNKCFQ